MAKNGYHHNTCSLGQITGIALNYKNMTNTIPYLPIIINMLNALKIQ